MHFKIDENLPARLKTLIDDAGHSASTVLDEGLAGAADPRIMEVCRHEEFALLTLDLEFANVVAYPAGSHHGVFVIRAGRLDASTISTLVLGLLQSGDLDQLRGWGTRRG